MPETLDYDRPLADPVESTPIAFKLLLSELPEVPAAVAVDGTTSDVLAYLELDVDDDVTVDWRSLFRIETAQALSISGILTLTITVTPILGNGSDGTPSVYVFTHQQNMDTIQTLGGFPRT